MMTTMMMNSNFNCQVMKTKGYLYRCNQLQQLLPAPVSKWLKVLSQPWEGDVTMVLPSTYSQIKKAVTNPSKRDLQIACLQVPHYPIMLQETHCCCGAYTCCSASLVMDVQGHQCPIDSLL